MEAGGECCPLHCVRPPPPALLLDSLGVTSSLDGLPLRLRSELRHFFGRCAGLEVDRGAGLGKAAWVLDRLLDRPRLRQGARRGSGPSSWTMACAEPPL
eukprot:scaffold2176_cov350-Prasinococcus_capsulatus_cf.AAC.10